MKDFTYCTILSLLVLIFVVHLYIDEVNNKKIIEMNQGNIFIWNDDSESIPVEGSLIKLEFTEGDTIYIGPVEEKTDTLMKSFMDRQHQD